MAGKKVEIVITEGHHYCESVKGGAAFTAVDYSASTYGGASPCDNDCEVGRAIRSAKENIRREGDIPVVVDRRKKAMLTNWLKKQPSE